MFDIGMILNRDLDLHFQADYDPGACCMANEDLDYLTCVEQQAVAVAADWTVESPQGQNAVSDI